MHGYGLKTESEAATGEVRPLNVGQVYTTLGRLERDGPVTSGADADGQNSIWLTTGSSAHAAIGRRPPPPPTGFADVVVLTVIVIRGPLRRATRMQPGTALRYQ
jgi:hypothetical protein